MDLVGKIKIGEGEFEIFDDGSPAVFIDIITEALEIGGIVAVGLASVVRDGDGKVRTNVAARLRMNLGCAEDLANTLLKLVEQNKGAKGKAN